jgi:hypothetical protein
MKEVRDFHLNNPTPVPEIFDIIWEQVLASKFSEISDEAKQDPHFTTRYLIRSMPVEYSDDPEAVVRTCYKSIITRDGLRSLMRVGDPRSLNPKPWVLPYFLRFWYAGSHQHHCLGNIIMMSVGASNWEDFDVAQNYAHWVPRYPDPDEWFRFFLIN